MTTAMAARKMAVPTHEDRPRAHAQLEVPHGRHGLNLLGTGDVRHDRTRPRRARCVGGSGHDRRQAPRARGHRRGARRPAPELRRVRLPAGRGPGLDARHAGCAAPDPARGPRATPRSTACASSASTAPASGRRRRTSTHDILDWTGDLELLLDALAHRHGRASSGSPAAVPTRWPPAPGLPDRVLGVGVLGGVAPTVGPDAADGGIIQLAVRLAPLLSATRVPLGVALTQAIRLVRPLAGPGLDLYAAVQPRGQEPAVAPGVQGDVPRRPAQRRPVPDARAAERPGAVHPRLGLRAVRRDGAGARGGTATPTTSCRSRTASTSSTRLPDAS